MILMMMPIVEKDVTFESSIVPLVRDCKLFGRVKGRDRATRLAAFFAALRSCILVCTLHVLHVMRR